MGLSVHAHNIVQEVEVHGWLLRPGMAKADLKSAFRLCPVHPRDYMATPRDSVEDAVLCRKMPTVWPQILSIIIDFNLVRMHFNGAIMMSWTPSTTWMISYSPAHHTQMTAHGLLQLYAPNWGTLKQEKLVLPSTKMGDGLDADKQIAIIPQGKLHSLLTSLRLHQQFYRDHTPITKRALLSLIGKLSFATKVIPAGGIFLRHLLDTAHSTLDFDAPLPTSPAWDSAWWLTFDTRVFIQRYSHLSSINSPFSLRQVCYLLGRA